MNVEVSAVARDGRKDDAMKHAGKLLITLVAVGIFPSLLFAPFGPIAVQPQIQRPATDTAVATPSLIRQASAEIPEVNKQQVLETYGKLPLSFEANQGQTDSQVKFLSRSGSHSLFLTSTEAVLTLSKLPAHRVGKRYLAAHQTQYKEIETLNRAEEVSAAGGPGTVLRMKLVGASPAPHVGGLRELQGKVNYFIGNDPKQWRTNVPTYAEVKYRNVYPGVDLVYYGNQQQLEYDFIVAPGADLRVIRLAFEGVGKAQVDESGDLMLRTADGEIRQHRPIVYQEVGGNKREIASRYLIEGADQVGFEVAEYDAARPLVIDPVLDYSTYLGGGGGDAGVGIAVDSARNAYVMGITNSSDFPTMNPLQPASGGSIDTFVAKLNPAGSALVYSTYLGGGGIDFGNSIAVDSAGNAYVTGNADSSNFPTANALQPTNSGYYDAFVTKLNAAGSALVYSTYLGGSGFDRGDGITVDSSGNAYLSGDTISTDFPTANPLQPALGGGEIYGDAFVTKLNASGSALVYSTYLGGSGDEIGNGIAVDASGNAYVAGATSGNFPTTAGAFQPIYDGSEDAFAARLNSAGSLLIYSTYLGGSNADLGLSIAADSSGNAYVVGWTDSTDFPMASPLQPANGGSNDTFVAKLNPAGSALVYSTYLGGSGDDFPGVGIPVDTAGNVYVTGFTNSTNFPVVNPLKAVNSGDCFGQPCFDAFIAKLNPTGSALVYSTYFGGTSDDSGGGIALDSSGSPYITGNTYSTDFPTVSALQPAYGGGSDGFVAKLVEFVTVVIDIRPGSYPNTINLGSGGTVRVAILSATDFDARTIDPTTVTLASAPVKLKGQGAPMSSFEDINKDGLLDLIVHVSTQALQLTETDTEAVLEGKTLDGRFIRGRDTVRVVP